ncbi:hypothetical protein STEG23_005418, partial [Scotinomys teguina]
QLREERKELLHSVFTDDSQDLALLENFSGDFQGSESTMPWKKLSFDLENKKDNDAQMNDLRSEKPDTFMKKKLYN